MSAPLFPRARTLRMALLLVPALVAREARAVAQATSDAAASSSSSASSSSAGVTDSSMTSAAPFGTAVRLGALPSPFASSGGLEGPAPLPRGLEFTPSIGLSEEALVGGFPKSYGFDNEFITSLTPGLRVVGTAPIGRVSLDYRPQLELYARESRDSGISQSLNGSFETQLIPGRLDLSASAFLTQQATEGGLAPGGSAAIAPNARTTTQSYLVSPHYRYRFRGLGRLDLVYLAQYTRQTGNSAALSGSQLPYFVPNDVFSQTGSAQFTTVPLFPDLDDVVLVTASQDTGTGVLDGSSQMRAEDRVRYAFLPQEFLIVSGGYENLRYQGFPPTHIADAVWSIGLHLHPRRDVDIRLAYRHRDGFDAPYLRATLQLTPRTTLSASYSETLATQAQAIAANLAGSTVSAGGQIVATGTQVPLLLTNNSLSVQSGLFRTRQFSIATITRWSRDRLSLNLVRSDETLVANAPGTSGFSQRSLSASATFSHQLTRSATVSAYFDYSTLDTPQGGALAGLGQSPVYTGALTGTYQTANRLEFDLQLAVTNTSLNGYGVSPGIAGNGVQASITFGVQKVF
ncbi:hypothetical protein [Acidiphilium sp.]|uniref:hypothetical protein n=1 Tax=Acidiphilium sp. TaxID=527 RepID=UPI0025888A06|nr:hypothetical protein [Acidiphilium sp.]